VRGTIRFFAALTAGLAILLGVLAWRLSSGPISIALLTPHVERALNSLVAPLRVTLDDTILSWAGGDRSVDIRVVGVKVLDDDATVLEMPELALSLSADALLHGQVAPRRIELIEPDLSLVKHVDGTVGIGFRQGPGDREFSFSFLAKLGEDAEGALAYLSAIDIVNATLTIEDQAHGTSWATSSVRARVRRDSGGIHGEMSLRPEVMGSDASITVSGDYRAANERIDLGVAFNKLNVSKVAELSQQLSFLASADMAVSGTANLSLSSQGELEDLDFTLGGGQGRFLVPEPFSQSLVVERLSVAGRYDGRNEVLELNDVYADLGPDGRLRLHSGDGDAVPMRWLRASGRYSAETGILDVTKVDADLQGPKAELTASISGLNGPLAIEGDVALRDLPVSGFRRYWPQAWGTNAWEWCVNNLSDGKVTRAQAKMKLVDDGNGLAVASVDGTMNLEGVTVAYYPPMAPLRGTNAHAKFDHRRFDITLTKGETSGLTLKNGTVALLGLDKRDQFADIDLSISGPVKNTLEFIERPPLGFASTVGLDPSKTSGTLDGRLKLYFILENSLRQDQVKAEFNATLRDVAIEKIALDLDLTDGQLTLKGNNDSIDISGPGRLGSIGGNIAWHRNFKPSAAFNERYAFRGRTTSEQRLNELKLDFPPFKGGMIDGPIDADIEAISYRDNRRQLVAKLDVTAATMSIEPVGWSKAAGEIGTANIEMAFQGTEARTLRRFAVDAGTLHLSGSGVFTPDGKSLERIAVDRISYPGTNLSGTITRRDDGVLSADLRGPSFDLAPFLEDKGDDAQEKDGGQPYTVLAKVEKVSLGHDQSMQAVSLALTNDGKRANALHFQGKLTGDKDFSLLISPGAPGRRKLAIHSDNGGEAFRAFDIYENAVDGILDIVGEYDDTQPASPLKGELSVRDFRVRNAPVLARLVTALTLTGLPELLRGEGLGFSELRMPFNVHRGVVTLDDARATGALGFTASGTIDRRQNVVDIEGTAVPAYVVNAALGKIPLIGGLFTGGEAGGGVFAATYTVKGDVENPDVSINPLSVLAPGFVRRLFGIFGGPGQPIPYQDPEERNDRER
jgi:hypothetical protein